MLGRKTCSGLTNKGERCRAYPLPDSEFCTFHDPRYDEAVSEGRKVGGQRRKREGTLAAAYDVTGTRSMDDLQRTTCSACSTSPLMRLSLWITR